MINAIGDKESGQHVYGIVQMPKKNDDSKDARESQENVSYKFIIFPKDECNEKRRAGVSREKEVIAGKDAVKNTSLKKD